MRNHKHNSNLCSVIFPDKRLPRKKSNKSQLKNKFFGWPLLFMGFFLLITFLPFQLIVKNIIAGYSKSDIINLYAHNVAQTGETDVYSEGWWNLDNSLLSPQAAPSSGLMDFNDQNSSFYTGGNFSLSFSGFKFLIEDLGELDSDADAQPGSAPFAGHEPSIADETELSSPLIIDPAIDEEASGDTGLKVESLDSLEINPEISDESELDNISAGDLGLRQGLKSYFGTTPASAIEVISSKVESLDDLGILKSASLKFSLALNDIGEGKSAVEEKAIEDFPGTSLSPTSEEDLSGDESEAEELDAEAVDEAEAPSLDPTFEDLPGAADGALEISGEEGGFSALEEPAPADSGLVDTLDIGNLEPDTSSVEILELAPSNETIIIDDTSQPEVSQMPREIADKNKHKPFSRFLGLVKEARAQDIEEELKMIIWYAIAPLSEGDEVVWHKLDELRGRNLSNALNGGYFSYEADFLNSWPQIADLRIKIEAMDANDSYIAYLDSVWVEAEYEPSEKVKKINQRKQWEKALQLVSDKKDFKMDESGTMRFHYQKKKQRLLDSFGEMLGLADYWEDVSVSAKIIDSKGQPVDLPLVLIFEEDGSFEASLPAAPRGRKPGKYGVVFEINDFSDGKNETISIIQDFSWGVLALNFNKSVYGEDDDSAYLQMAVLDDYGRTLCNADLTLRAVSPSGIESFLTTGNGQIARNQECGPDNVIDSPDYYAFYMLDEIGVYAFSLGASTTNGYYEIEDSIIKEENLSYDVERTGPTRIYPLANY
jgi:hypothetical protein